MHPHLLYARECSYGQSVGSCSQNALLLTYVVQQLCPKLFQVLLQFLHTSFLRRICLLSLRRVLLPWLLCCHTFLTHGNNFKTPSRQPHSDRNKCTAMKAVQK